MVGREGQQKPWTQGLPLQSWSLALHAGRTGHAERVVLASIGLLSIWGPQMASTPIPGYKTKAKPHLVYHGFIRKNSSTPSGIWSSRGESQPKAALPTDARGGPKKRAPRRSCPPVRERKITRLWEWP